MQSEMNVLGTFGDHGMGGGDTPYHFYLLLHITIMYLELALKIDSISEELTRKCTQIL